MGASAVILFIILNSPLAHPWPLVGGQLVSTVIGVACAQLVSDTAFASDFVVSGSVLAMLLLIPPVPQQHWRLSWEDIRLRAV